MLQAHKVIDGFAPDHVLSLQNMVVPLTSRKQVVYIHNPLPKGVCDLSFSIVHDPVMWVRQNLIGSIILRSARKADEVIVQTEWFKRRLVERCGVDAAKVRVEPPAFEAHLPLAARDREGGDFVFFYPASAVPFKNHDIVISACELLAAEGVGGYRAVLTVDGSESPRMAALCERAESAGLPIDFHGWMSPEEMGRWYANSDCLIFPSRLETWGLPLKEAQAYGLPILASDLEYAHETVGNYGQVEFFDPLEPSDLAEKMLRFTGYGDDDSKGWSNE